MAEAKKRTVKKATPKTEAKKEFQFCQNCGEKIPKDAEFCMSCGKLVGGKKPVATATTDNSKLYNILSYLNLWLIGMLAAKDDKNVQFHVGQGILNTILYVAIVILGVIVRSIFVTTYYRGTIWEYRVTSGVGLAISWLLWLVPAAFSVIGIINAYNNQEKPLPLIGKLSFYPLKK